MSRRIFIRDLKLQVSIGIHDFERRNRQTVRVDVDLWLAPPAKPLADDIANVLDYDSIHGGICKLGESRHFNLQETFCEAILDLCFANSQVSEVRVSIEKPDVYADCRVGYEAVRRRPPD